MNFCYKKLFDFLKASFNFLKNVPILDLGKGNVCTALYLEKIIKSTFRQYLSWETCQVSQLLSSDSGYKSGDARTVKPILIM